MTISALSVHEVLRREVGSLPESLAQEVLDFVLLVRSRHEEEAFLWERVEDARSYREQHPEEVVTASAEEWETATAHMDQER